MKLHRIRIKMRHEVFMLRVSEMELNSLINSNSHGKRFLPLAGKSYNLDHIERWWIEEGMDTDDY